MEDFHPPKLKVLKSQCKVDKHEFASSERAMVYIEEFQTDEDLDIRITRMEFEVKCQDLFARILDTVEEALEYSDVFFEDIDEMIMIGESSFSGFPPLETTARGVTVLATVFSANKDVPDIQELKCHDSCQLPLGREIVGAECLFTASCSRLPARHEAALFTSVHNPTNIDIHVNKGQWLMTRRNRQLAFQQPKAMWNL
jgi:molecular chaperone DnaK (HSP70)